jgi:hypothetical protein
VYGQLKRELAQHADIISKYIVLHDTTLFGDTGQVVPPAPYAYDARQEHLKRSGFSIDDVKQGLWKAVTEFLEQQPEWELMTKLTEYNGGTHNCGLTVLRRVGRTPANVRRKGTEQIYMTYMDIDAKEWLAGENMELLI